MTDQIREDLMTLYAAAKNQQEALQRSNADLIKCLAEVRAEVAALKAERMTITPTIKAALTDGVPVACADIATQSAHAVGNAMGPHVREIQSAVVAIRDLPSLVAAIREQMQAILRWLSWRLIGKLAAILGAGVLVAWCIAVGSVWYQRAEVEQLKAQAARLRVDDCEKYGGPKGRQCLPVDISHLYGDKNDKKQTVFYYPVW